MGGLMVLWASAMTTGVAGVISVCPALAIGDSASSKPLLEFFKLMPVTLLGKIFPQLPLTKGPRGISFSDDPKLKELAEEESDLDPLEYKGRLKVSPPSLSLSPLSSSHPLFLSLPDSALAI